MSNLERARDIVRSELEKAHPVADARRSLELIVESSIRVSGKDGDLSISVLDERGERRAATRDGAPAFTIADLIAELRERHPTLFERQGKTLTAAPIGQALLGNQQRVDEVGRDLGVKLVPASAIKVDSSHSTGRTERDWLRLGDGNAEPASKVAADGAEKAVWDRPIAGVVAKITAAASELRARAEAARSEFRVSSAAPNTADELDAPQQAKALVSPNAPRAPASTSSFGQALWRTRAALAGGAVVVVLAMSGGLASWLASSSATNKGSEGTAVAARPPDPPSTGSVPGSAQVGGALRGVPEVIDTATLSLQGKVVPLFGVQWVRGAGEPSDLTSYLRGREVTCQPSPNDDKAFRCEVEGQDLSKVILYNGGGRTTSTATPDLQAAEAHARTTRVGLWSR